MFEELPNVDYLWQLLNNILLVRSESLLELEIELYDELIFIHRDPTLLIQRTRLKIKTAWIQNVIYVFQQFIFSSSCSIIGIYITFVLALSRILRIMVINSSMRIMFEQLPNVDKILKLLNSIYMVRENKKFMLEEKLFSKLIFLYRSPQTMIKYTRNTKLNSLAYIKKKQ